MQATLPPSLDEPNDAAFPQSAWMIILSLALNQHDWKLNMGLSVHSSHFNGGEDADSDLGNDTCLARERYLRDAYFARTCNRGE